MQNIYIQSGHLQLAEPLMQKYFDYDSSMLADEIRNYILHNHIPCSKIENGISILDVDTAFRENKDLAFIVTIPYKQMIYERFNTYFISKSGDISEDDIVLLCLMYMSYIYHKTEQGFFNKSGLIELFDLEYEGVLHNYIYPEILSLYKMILQSKTKKNKGAKVTITYKQDKIDVNTCAWFLDDMEKYFKDRFPDLTLDKINQLLPDNKSKAGRKFTNRTTNNLIWGTYQLLYNHHSKFKNAKTRISEEICQFIIDYLDIVTGIGGNS